MDVDMEQVVHDMEQRQEELQQQLQQRDTTITELKADNEKQKAALESHKVEMGNLKLTSTQATESALTADRLREELRQAQEACDRRTSELHRVNDTRGELETSLKQLQEKARLLQEKLWDTEGAESLVKQELETLKKRHASLESHNSSIMQEVDKLNTELLDA
ncbi:unnamed protein product, partial [Chrysoparadoxa australica]